MRYAGLKKNDIANGEGVCVSFWTQGCPHRCKNCHNPETWNFNGGKEFTPETLEEICSALTANNVNRSFSVLGGEPLCEENTFLTYLVIKTVKERLPNIKIYLWTGYYYDQLQKLGNPRVPQILELVDVLIDGPYIDEQRDITLQMRGSANQSIIDLAKLREEQQ